MAIGKSVEGGIWFLMGGHLLQVAAGAPSTEGFLPLVKEPGVQDG